MVVLAHGVPPRGHLGVETDRPDAGHRFAMRGVRLGFGEGESNGDGVRTIRSPVAPGGPRSDP